MVQKLGPCVVSRIQNATLILYEVDSKLFQLIETIIDNKSKRFPPHRAQTSYSIQKIIQIKLKEIVENNTVVAFSLCNSNLFCKIAGTIRRVKDFIVKNGEVQSKAKPNWMSWW